MNHSAQFRWDNEVLQFLEALEYYGGRRVVNLLRDEGHAGEGGWSHLTGESGIGHCQERRHGTSSMKSTQRRVVHVPHCCNPLFTCIKEQTPRLYEDNHEKVLPVVLAKDAMQLKPGLLFDSRQGKLVGSTINIDHKFIKDHPEPERKWRKSHVSLPFTQRYPWKYESIILLNDQIQLNQLIP